MPWKRSVWGYSADWWKLESVDYQGRPLGVVKFVPRFVLPNRTTDNAHAKLFPSTSLLLWSSIVAAATLLFSVAIWAVVS